MSISTAEEAPNARFNLDLISRFSDLPLAHKVLLIPLLTLFLLGIILAVAVRMAASNTAALESLDRDAFAPQHEAIRLQDRMTVNNGQLFSLLSKKAIENDPIAWKNDASALVETLDEQSDALLALTETLRGRAPAERLDELTKAYNAYLGGALNMIDVASTDAGYGALMMLTVNDRFGVLRKRFDVVVDGLSERRLAQTERLIRNGRLAQPTMIVLGSVAAILALLGSALVGRGITRPTAHLIEVINRLAEGDTTQPVSGTARRDEVGDIARAIEVFRRNAIARQLGDRALARTHWQLDIALNNMSHGLCLFDAAGELLLWNRRTHEVLGIEAEVMRPGLTSMALVTACSAAGLHILGMPDDRRDAQMDAIREGLPLRFGVSLPNGRSVSVCRTPLPEGGWVTTFEDTTEQRQGEERIIYLARHDPLTGLPNRRLFQERLAVALARAARGERFAVLCLDLDRFKNVNDTLGHDVGDELLRGIAERLRSCVREIDTVARLGGDEFAILQENIADADSAAELAARIIQVARGTFEINGHEVTVGTSVGIAIAPDQGSSAGTLLKHADVALYAAKEERGRYSFFEAAMADNLQRRRVMEMDLRGALARGEFELYFQPLLNADTEQVLAFEALVRWSHPERGLIAPEEFIPLAEETGLIIPLGDWVLLTACRAAINWPDDIKIAVNLSPIQFRGTRLPEMVAQALLESRLPPERLELEITESVLLTDNEPTLATLHRLRDLGVRISMDDFGTGYSSLSYLRKFPFDKIKIDRSFIQDLSSARGTAEIVRAITALSRGLGMTTVAEGVETFEQLEQLRREGCVEVQGYLFSPPVPAARVPDLLARMRRLAPVAA